VNSSCSPTPVGDTPATSDHATKPTWIKGVKDKPYDVVGKTTQDVSKDIFNPKKGKGFGKKKHAARLICNVKYGISFHLSKHKTEGGCSCKATTISPIKIDMHPAVKFPKWKGYKSASHACQLKWDKFMKALKVHEQGHLKICRKESQRIFNKFKKWEKSSTKNGSDCKKACNTAMDAISMGFDNAFGKEMAKSDKKHDDYDKRTKHGKTQGAVLNGC